MKTSCRCELLLGSFLTVSTVVACAQPYAISSIAGAVRQAGSSDGTNSGAQFKAPAGLALDFLGNLYLADPNAIRRVAPLGTNWAVTTLAGLSNVHGASDGTNSGALFNYPQGVAGDNSGKLFVADTYNNAIRLIVPQGTNWVVTTIAGLLDPFGSGDADGTNSVARFNQPYGIAVDAAGTLYVADTLNHMIRKVAPAGTNWVVTTLAGSSTNSGGGDGTNGNAQFTSPVGMVMDNDGQLYVADSGASTIRRLTPQGTNWVVTTIAGMAGSQGSADGAGGSARFKHPWGIALDAAHNLFVTDSSASTIRKVTPAGVVSTLAGLAGTTGTNDGIGSVARFTSPNGIGVSSSGALFIADSGNVEIRRGEVAPWLRIAQLGPQVAVSWPVALTGFVLQASSSLSNRSWTNITSGVGYSAEFLVFTNPSPSAAGFYRLYQPGP